jgi:hypothetical protein
MENTAGGFCAPWLVAAEELASYISLREKGISDAENVTV